MSLSRTSSLISASTVRVASLKFRYNYTSRVALIRTMSTPSKACCNTPPVVAKGYKPKGEYITIAGRKTYRTGPKDASKAIFLVKDIFDFFPQTVQGADILSSSDDHNKYQVFVPDFFEGDPADITWFPPTDEDKQTKLGNFFKNQGDFPKALDTLKSVYDEITKDNPAIKAWGILGFCWGGKLVNQAVVKGTQFKAAATGHPAMIDPADAPKVTVPILVIASKDEDKEALAKYSEALTVKKQVETYDDQIHGFMAARSNLEDPAVVKAYEKAYQQVLTFFHSTV